MHILVIGVKGSFGKAVEMYLSKNGHKVSGVGRGDTLPIDCGIFDACILAVPVTEVEGYVEKLRGCQIIEISSTKNKVARFRGEVVSIHPMFGPKSIDSRKHSDIIFISDISPAGSQKLIEEMFPGFNIIRMTADEHDKVIADLLVKPYIFSLLANLITIGEHQVSCTSFETLLDLMRISGSESKRVLEDTIRFNPYAQEILQKIQLGTSGMLQTLGEGKNFTFAGKSESEHDWQVGKNE